MTSTDLHQKGNIMLPIYEKQRIYFRKKWNNFRNKRVKRNKIERVVPRKKPRNRTKTDHRKQDYLEILYSTKKQVFLYK